MVSIYGALWDYNSTINHDGVPRLYQRTCMNFETVVNNGVKNIYKHTHFIIYSNYYQYFLPHQVSDLKCLLVPNYEEILRD
jgi:hypothetical protein